MVNDCLRLDQVNVAGQAEPPAQIQILVVHEKGGVEQAGFFQGGNFDQAGGAGAVIDFPAPYHHFFCSQTLTPGVAKAQKVDDIAQAVGQLGQGVKQNLRLDSGRLLGSFNGPGQLVQIAFGNDGILVQKHYVIEITAHGPVKTNVVAGGKAQVFRMSQQINPGVGGV